MISALQLTSDLLDMIPLFDILLNILQALHCQHQHHLYSRNDGRTDGRAAREAKAWGHRCCWQKGSNGVNVCVLHVCGRSLSLASADHGPIAPVDLPETIMKWYNGTKGRLATSLVRAHPFTSVVLEGSALVKHIAFRSQND